MEHYKPIRGTMNITVSVGSRQVCRRCGRETQRQGKRNQDVYVCGSCRRADPWYVAKIGA